jgi:hypothetical protein
MDWSRHRDDHMRKPPSGVIPKIQFSRRSNRRATSFPIWLRNEALGAIWEEETETQIVSRYGAGLLCRHLVSAESILIVVHRDTGRRAKARVKYSRYNSDGKREVGIEFIDDNNFWGLDWNSSEPIYSQPEQMRVPSGVAQISEAIFATGIGEAEGRQSKIERSSELNSDTRKSKRLDAQLSQEERFVFTEGGKPVGTSAQTLKEFISSLTNSAPSVVEGHIHRGDFSRWIADVLDDHFLALETQKLEQRYRNGHAKDLCDSLARLIAEYCELSDGP